MPSGRGQLHPDDEERYPYLAIELGFLRKGTFSLLVRGQAFLSLIQEQEKNAFRALKAVPPDLTINPLLLSASQKLIFLFSLIERDGDALMQLYDALLNGPRQFTDRQAGNLLPQIYRNIAKSARSHARSGEDLLKIQRLGDTADKIEAVERKRSPGGKNPREHAVTFRLEPFVDFGLLSKPSPFEARYEMTRSGRLFFGKLLETGDIDLFLQTRFLRTAQEALGIDAVHVAQRNVVLPAIEKAYKALKSPLGYVPILELALLAGICSMTEKACSFEISETIEILKALQKEKPRLVRFNVDRSGALSVVKFPTELKDA